MMRPLSELLTALADRITPAVTSEEAGLALRVSQLDLELPVEAQIGPGGELAASLPRGRLATGFDPLLGKVIARFEVRPR
jgi:hypothetical protein